MQCGSLIVLACVQNKCKGLTGTDLQKCKYGLSVGEVSVYCEPLQIRSGLWSCQLLAVLPALKPYIR